MVQVVWKVKENGMNAAPHLTAIKHQVFQFWYGGNAAAGLGRGWGRGWGRG